MCAATLAEEKRALIAAHQARDEALRRSVLLEQQAATAHDAEHAAMARTAAIAARVQAAEADVEAGISRVDVVEALRRGQRGRLAAAQKPAFQLIAALQLIGKRPPALALVAPGSLNDIVHLRAVLSAVAPVIAARTANLRTEVQRGVKLRAQADQALAALRESRAQLVKQQSALAADAEVARAHAAALSDHALSEQDRAIAMGEKARDIRSLMATITAEADISDALAALPGPNLRPANLAALDNMAPAPDAVSAPPTIQYRLPVVGTIVAGMGEETTPGVRARGLTIATAPNAIVVAPSSGRIAFAGSYRGFGQIIIINHGQGLTTLITNLSRLSTRVGTSVISGSPLGYAGSEQPTIMIELRRGATPIDITPLLS